MKGEQTKPGLLWFDDNPNKTTADKIRAGARRYYAKFREAPNLVKVNPASDIPAVSGLTIVRDRATLPHNYLIGRSKQK